jgi:hypothetical protein
MNVNDQTFAAFSLANQDRKKSLLQYVSEGATNADLEAAGYTPAEVAAAFPPTKPVVVSKEFDRDRQAAPKETPMMQQTTPTLRDNFRENVRRGASALGADDQYAQFISGRIAGTGGDLGLIDATGLGVIPGVQEGVQQAKRGYKTGSNTDVAMGALNTGLNVLGAIPGGKLAVKGLSKLAEKSLAAYDPNVVRMFAGPEAKNFPHLMEAEASVRRKAGEDPQKIWEDTGIQYLPDGRPIFQIDPAGAKILDFDFFNQAIPKLSAEDVANGGDGQFRQRLTDLVEFPEFFENYPQLKDFNLVFDPDIPADGQMDISRKTVKLSIDFVKNATEQKLKETLLHELQHGIQAAERTSGGAASSYFFGRQKQWNSTTQQWERTGPYVTGAPDMEPDVQNYQMLLDDYMDSRSNYEKNPGSTQAESDVKHAELERKRGILVEDAKRLNTWAFRKYQENPGEIEARAAGLWSQLTPEERLKTPPLEIYNRAAIMHEPFASKLGETPTYGDNYMPTTRFPASQEEALSRLDPNAEMTPAQSVDQTVAALGEVPVKKTSQRFIEGTPEKKPITYVTSEENIVRQEDFLNSTLKDQDFGVDSSNEIVQNSNLGDVSTKDFLKFVSEIIYSPNSIKDSSDFMKNNNIVFSDDVLKSIGYVDNSGNTTPAEAMSDIANHFYHTYQHSNFRDFLYSHKIEGIPDNLRSKLEKPFNTTYRNPINEVIDEITFPKNGLKGSEFIKFLDKNPSVKSAQYNTIDLGIDKNKSYTKEQLLSAIDPYTWETKIEVLPSPQYENMQVQNFNEHGYTSNKKVADYKELVLRVNRKNPDLPTFTLPEEIKKAYGSYHYSDDVVAHTRLSTETQIGTNTKEIVVHEFQSDYLQRGAAKASPAVDITEAKSKLLSNILSSIPKGTDTPEVKFVVEKSFEELLANGGYFSSEVGRNLNSALKNAGISIDDRIPVTNALFEAEAKLRDFDTKGVTKLPLANVKDSAENLLDGVLGYAQHTGVDKVFIPSIEQLASTRFVPGTLEFFDAVNPGSYFYNTYSQGLDKAVGELSSKTGAEVTDSIRNSIKATRYKTLPKDIGQLFVRDMQVGLEYRQFLNKKITEVEFLKRTGLSKEDGDKFFSNYSKDLFKASKAKNDKEWYKAFRKSSFNDALDNYGIVKYLDNIGTQIDIGDAKQRFDFTKPRYAKGGLVGYAQGGTVEDEQMNRLMQEGGMADAGVAQEPVTGNEVPPGALPSEVRDDVPVQLSEGEYVVPADVLRFFGVRFFEDLRNQAKQGMAEMQSNGRIGGASVDSNGVPTEDDDDELTPEEEQMLQAAMGGQEAPTGMAEGGVVPFDRSKFTLSNNTSERETRKYIDPKTGITQMFQFFMGSPVSPIPTNFVPWTQELQDAAAKPVTPTIEQPKVARNDRDRDSVDIMKDAKDSGGFNYSGWAEKNYDAITANPYQFGLDALTDDSGKFASKGLGIAGLATGILPLAFLGMGVKAGNKMQNIAEASAALQLMEAKGLTGTADYVNLSKVIGIATDALPSAQQLLIEKHMAATGDNYVKAITGMQAKAAPAVAPTTPTGAAPKASTSSGTVSSLVDRREAEATAKAKAPTQEPTVARSSGSGGIGPKATTSPSNYSNYTSAGTGTSQPLTKTSVVSTPSGPKTVVSSTSPSKAPTNAGSTRFKDGGLITRPTKK